MFELISEDNDSLVFQIRRRSAWKQHRTTKHRVVQHGNKCELSIVNVHDYDKLQSSSCYQFQPKQAESESQMTELCELSGTMKSSRVGVAYQACIIEDALDLQEIALKLDGLRVWRANSKIEYDFTTERKRLQYLMGRERSGEDILLMLLYQCKYDRVAMNKLLQMKRVF